MVRGSSLPTSATDSPCDPSSAAKASPAGPQPTTHTSAVVARGSKGCNTAPMDGCSASSLLACISERQKHPSSLIPWWEQLGGTGKALIIEHTAGYQICLTCTGKLQGLTYLLLDEPGL